MAVRGVPTDAEARGDKQPRMGNSGSINATQTDRPPDEIFQVFSRPPAQAALERLELPRGGCSDDARAQIKVTNAGNSCYMDAVLFSMFAMPSSLDTMLTKRQPSSDHMVVQKQELQASILKQFVGRLRHCEHVTAESMINIRSMCRKVGWEYPGAPDMQQDAGEFFAFLYGCLGGQLIKTTRRTFTGALPDSSDHGHQENMALLPVALCDSSPRRNDELDLSSLVDNFFFENVAAGLRRKVQGQQQEVYALNTYSVDNVPCMVAVSLKRFDEQLLKIESQVDFPSQLHLHKYSSRMEWRSSPIMQSVPWTLKSVVCHRGRSTHAGHYYAYTRYSKNDSSSAVWLRLDDEGTPCITQTNIWQDPYVKSEAVLFLYELDSDAHTAAMMMLQEDQEDMFEAQDAYGFGFGGYGQSSFGGNGGSAGAYEIPQSLPPSLLSALAGGLSASRSTSQSMTSRSTGGADHSASTRQPPGVGSASQDGNQAVDTQADPKDQAPDPQPDAKAEDSKDSEEAQTAPTNTQPDKVDEAIPLCLQNIDFLVTPHRGVPMVATRNLDGRRGDEDGDSRTGNEKWEVNFEVEAGESFVCVSSMASLHSEASLGDRQFEVSILRLSDKEQVCSSVLSAKHPSAIFSLGSPEMGLDDSNKDVTCFVAANKAVTCFVAVIKTI